MNPHLYIKKTANSLYKIILKIQSRNRINYHTVRMSDLCDEIYKDSALVDNESFQNEIECSKQVEIKNEKKELQHGKNRILIRFKICDIPDETATDLLIDMSIRKNGSTGYSFNGKKFLKQFQSELSDRTFIIELTECANSVPPLEYNINSQINNYKQKNESGARASPIQEDLIVPKQFNYRDQLNGIIDLNLTMHIVKNLYKPECKETSFDKEEMHLQNLYVPPKEMNGKSCVVVQDIHDIATFTSEEDKCIYFHSDKNEGTSKTNIQEESGFESIELCSSDTFQANTYEEGIITETSSNSRQHEDQENMSEQCYVIEINIPKESNSEDECNKQVDIMSEVVVEKNDADTKENISISSLEIETVENFEDNTLTDIGQKNMTPKNCSIIYNNTNEKTIDYQDTNKAIETSYNNEVSITKSSTMTSKLRNTDKEEKDKKNSLIAQQNKSRINSSQCSLDEEKIKDSLIIKDIVMTKYGETLKEFRQRSLRRKKTRKTQSLRDNTESLELKQKLNRPTSLDIKDFQCKNFSHLSHNSKTPDSGLGATQDLNFSNCRYSESFQDSNESFKYSSMIFLKQALGEEYMNTTFNSEQENLEKHFSTPLQGSYKSSHGVSIGSSEISTLISTTIDSLYSTVDKSKKKRSSDLKKTSEVHPNSTTLDNYIYESIQNFKINLKSEELKAAISIQSAIIAQVSKALSLCKESPVFFGSIPHLEAEKYLLFATYKKLILENQLNRDYEDMGLEPCYGTVNIENLRFTLNTGHALEINKTTEEYYICLLHSDVTLLVSNIVLPERNGKIIFKQSFQFNNLGSDFQIYIKIFSMVLENKHKRRLSPTKLRSSWRNGKICNKRTDGLPQLTSFRLIGTSKIEVTDIYTSNLLYLEEASSKGRICDTFMADIHSSIKISNNIKGFLTIGTTNVLWNRRWCVLEGPFLKYWNYPSDENDKEPLGIFDLSDCATHQVTNVNKTVCFRPRTVMLQIKSEGEVKQYFLQADNLVEFEEWKRQLNLVLMSLNNWKCLKN